MLKNFKRQKETPPPNAHTTTTSTPRLLKLHVPPRPPGPAPLLPPMGGLVHVSSRTSLSLFPASVVFICSFFFFCCASLLLQQHAILILGLVRAGDLEDAMMKDPQRRLEPDRVYFYMAEISLALQHMHDLGMLYRDLKPCNILLTEEGHVQLTDMGLAAEVEPDKAAEHYDCLTDHQHEHEHHHDDHNNVASPTMKVLPWVNV
jgi:serine/threonine protein kinase